MADEQQAAPTGTYATAIDNVRSTAKWVMASLAAVGGVLVTGLSLTSLSQIDDETRFVGALVAILVALVAVCLEVGYTARVLQPSTVTIDDIAAAETDSQLLTKPMKDVFEQRDIILRGIASSFTELRNKYLQALVARTDALEANFAAPNTDTADKATAAQERAKLYTQVVRHAVTVAGYDEVRDRLKLRWQVVGGVVIALAVAVFAGLLAWPQTEPDRIADFHGARLADVDLSGVSFVGASFSKMTLSDVDLHGADLRGANFRKAHLVRVDLSGATTKGAHWDHAVWAATTCPDATLSDNAGGRCRGHLNPVDDR
jgi:uncharacterized protein YjbI with pentapeptide repeats